MQVYERLNNMGADTAPNSRLFDLARLEREKSDFEGTFQKTSEVEASSDLDFDGDAVEKFGLTKAFLYRLD